MILPVKMLQRALPGKTLPCFARVLFFSRLNNSSDSASAKSESDNSSSNVEKLQNEHPASDIETSSGEENVARLVKEAATYSDAANTNWATSPYPAGVPTSLEEADAKPKIDPLDTCVVLFPGQGTIKVGQVQRYLRFPQAKELFEMANEILNYNLLKLCLEGPQEKLNQTQFNQPATVVTSLAGLEKLREERPRVFETCVATAGYSIGELTSLIFSGVFTFEEGLRLVSVRGTAMQYASEKSSQGMLSVYCAPDAKISQACKDAVNWAQDNGVENPVCQ